MKFKFLKGQVQQVYGKVIHKTIFKSKFENLTYLRQWLCFLDRKMLIPTGPQTVTSLK